jgi:hypothetical protein
VIDRLADQFYNDFRKIIKERKKVQRDRERERERERETKS